MAICCGRPVNNTVFILNPFSYLPFLQTNRFLFSFTPFSRRACSNPNPSHSPNPNPGSCLRTCPRVCFFRIFTEIWMDDIHPRHYLHKDRKRVHASTIILQDRFDNVGCTVEGKSERGEIKDGLLIEFRNDFGELSLAVVHGQEGNNWVVYDQKGMKSSIKPCQISYTVPGLRIFNYEDISEFYRQAKGKLDGTLLESAWKELIETDKSITAEELAELIFDSREPLYSYCAHHLLSRDEVYFTVLQSEGLNWVYSPRPILQLNDICGEEFLEFIRLLNDAKMKPRHEKPTRSSWHARGKILQWLESLEACAVDTCVTSQQRKAAEMILVEMGFIESSSEAAAASLLIDIGYFTEHVNLDLLKHRIPTCHPPDVLLAADHFYKNTPDLDEEGRTDLTHLKVYVIDVEKADELDDGLSASLLCDGRIKVWIHVADPSRFVSPGSSLDREALKRVTSVYLPEVTYHMFPEKVAMCSMSLRQGEACRSITVSVVLHPDGSIAECDVENSIIIPTYVLAYHSATELLHLNLEEEPELKWLSEAASVRLRWRCSQGGTDTTTIGSRVKVLNPEDPKPTINIYTENNGDAANRIVSEMMILCGEAVSMFGRDNDIPLPYRGQPQNKADFSGLDRLPAGPVRSSALVRAMHGAEFYFHTPISHGTLGLAGYVQFTSPIRRYMDLLSHYQVKAVIRGEPPPFSAGELEEITSICSFHGKTLKKICSSGKEYWILELLRRKPSLAKYSALILRIFKGRLALLLLIDLGYETTATISGGHVVGDLIEVRVEKCLPRPRILILHEVSVGPKR